MPQLVGHSDELNVMRAYPGSPPTRKASCTQVVSHGRRDGRRQFGSAWNGTAAIDEFMGPERTPLFIVPHYFVSMGLG
jgi:hypothetical protein